MYAERRACAKKRSKGVTRAHTLRVRARWNHPSDIVCPISGIDRIYSRQRDKGKIRSTREKQLAAYRWRWTHSSENISLFLDHARLDLIEREGARLAMHVWLTCRDAHVHRIAYISRRSASIRSRISSCIASFSFRLKKGSLKTDWPALFSRWK